MNNQNQLPKKWILIRGLMRSRFHWKTFPDQLKTKLQLSSVQAVELVGNGFLFDKDTPGSIDGAIAQIRAQITYDGADSFALVGVSLGGMLATRWAQLFPNEISHLVLINSSSKLTPFTQRLLPLNYPGIIKHLLLSDPAASEEFILRQTSNVENIWKPHLSENIEFLKSHPMKTLNFIRQLKLAGQTDFTEVPKATKLVLASKADRLVSFKCSERISQVWGCKIQYHETAGHDLPLDDPDWVIENIKNTF